MCIESAVVLVCFGSSPWKLASESWHGWRGFPGWHALQLNVRKTKVLTTQSQSPTEVPLRNGQAIEVVDRGSTHKWLGCMLCTANTGNHSLDLAHHLHAASKAFFANRPYLVNRNVAMQDRFRYFNAMVIPVACCGAAHRKVYKQDLCKKDIVFRRLLRSIVGPPGDVDWTLPWHEILHHHFFFFLPLFTSA